MSKEVDINRQNYIYLFHTDEFLYLPEYPDEISDKMTSTFAQTNALARTAPVFTYSNSGPRTVNIRVHLHRDLIEFSNSGSRMKTEDGEDLVDALIKKIQAIALPTYNAEMKKMTPPSIAVRIGNELFVRGVVQGGVSITYEKPIIKGNKYAQATIAFDVYETDPYDAVSVSKAGSFRGLTSTFKDGRFV